MRVHQYWHIMGLSLLLAAGMLPAGCSSEDPVSGESTVGGEVYLSSVRTDFTGAATGTVTTVLEGILVTLQKEGVAMAATACDAAGHYQFSDVSGGSYTVHGVFQNELNVYQSTDGAEFEVSGESGTFTPDPVLISLDRDLNDVSFDMQPVFPNPGTTVTNIRFTNDASRHINISVYTAQGFRVRTLVNAPRSALTYLIEWNFVDSTNAAVPAGLYLIQASSNDLPLPLYSRAAVKQ